MIRAPKSLSAALTAVLCVGLLVGTAQGAVAADKAPNSAPTPDFGDPVPGYSAAEEGTAGAPESSENASTPDEVRLEPSEAVEVQLPGGDGDGTKTDGAEGTTTAEVTGGWRDVPGQPLAVADAGDGDAAASSVEVRVVDPSDVNGLTDADLVIEVARADDSDESTEVAVRLPDAVLESKYGAGYAHRVAWTQVVGGASTDSPAAVATASTPDGTVATPTVAAGPTLLMATSSTTASDGTGYYGATPLKSSSTWDVAEQTGGFGWTYDMPLPPAGVGPQPSTGLTYSSQSVDGLTGSTNNQPSAVGEGWDLNGTGFIERRYVSCATDDGATGAVATSGDLCWKTDNATVSMAGHSGALVKDTTSGKWRLSNDDGTRFEYLQGTGQGCASNGTNSTDCWRMTTTDGTQYYFGLNRLPGWTTGKPVTNSAWTVPVFGNDPGEPCKASTFAASACTQAWRWNLDYVVDVHGNAQANYYTAETNKYAKNGSGATSYVRGGVLSRIEYGVRSNNLYGANAAGFKVNFTYDGKGRCNDATGAACTTQSLDYASQPSTPSRYPDVPWDRLCTAASCSTSQASPSFFTNARLQTVQAQVLVGGSYSTTDSWALSHSFPAPGDGTNAALWLTKVQHTGSRAGQAAITTPATEFSGTTMHNRVWAVDGLVPLAKWRLSSIKTDLGAVISVNYAPAQCTPSDVPTLKANPESNTKWCYPEWWLPENVQPPGPRLDLFHKYRVQSVHVDAVTGPALSQVMRTQYSYGTPKWRYNESPLVPVNRRTWNTFAGVDTVEVREGDPAAPSAQKVTKYWYYQGINGDRANASGGTKSATVTGTTIPDERWFAGQLHRQQTLLGVGGAVLSDTTSTPWASGVTANNGTVQARMVNVGRTVVSEPLSTGGNRTLDTQTTFDATYGYATSQSVVPSDAASKCVSTTYAAPNTSAWIIGAPSEVRTVAKSCGALGSAQFPQDLISHERTAYDGLGWGAAPTKGLPTTKQAVDKYVNGQPNWAAVSTSTYDALGRALVTTDPLGRTTTTAYTPAAALPLTATAVTNPAPFFWTTNTTFEPTTGTQSSVSDPNGALTTMDVDALGRTSKVWKPLRPKASNPSSPSLAYEYTLSQTAPNATKTTTYKAGSNVVEFQLFDGLGRPVQTQAVATSGGSVITTTSYDVQGRAYLTDNAYWTTSVTPSVALFVPDSQNAIPSHLDKTFDAVGRVTRSSLYGLGQLRSSTAQTYLGSDRADTVPAMGGTPTSAFKNALGQDVKLVQYSSSTVTGTGQTTTYDYDGAGHLTSMTDPAGNEWEWTFDLRGFRTSHSNPDSGTSTATFDNAGNVLTATDARGQTIATTYDALDRRTATYSGTTNGPMLASWTYDTVKRGMVTSSSSYVGSTPGTPGAPYTNTVVTYNAAGDVTRSTVSIPTSAPGFGGTTYTTTAGYYADSSLSVRNVPAVGGLPAEQILYSYDAWGRLSNVRGNGGILNNTIYTPIGQLAQFNRLNLGAEAYSTYGYDTVTGAVMNIKDNAVFAGSGHYVADRVYTRDKIGNVTSASTSSVLPAPRTQVYCYKYDKLQQLETAWSPAAASSCAQSPTTSALSGPAPAWIEYTYDAATGNRTSVTSRASNGTTKAAAYAYPAPGSAQPHAVSTITGDASLGAGSYSTDPAGNVTLMPGKTLTFNEGGKLATVVAGAASETHIYDASGSLLLRVNSVDGTTLFLGDTVLTKPPSGTATHGIRTYAGAQNIPVAERSATTGTSGSTVTWLFSDVTRTVDTRSVASSGDTEQTFRDPFGGSLGGADSFWANGNGFLNKPGTPSTGLTSVGARSYSPLLGKFVSVDPITDPQNPQQNTAYAYGRNNPVTTPDPTGLAPGMMLSDGCGRGACGGTAAKTYTSTRPPGYGQSVATGLRQQAIGDRLLGTIPKRGMWEAVGWTQMAKDNEIRAKAQVHFLTASFFQSQQGALVYGFARGAWNNAQGPVRFGAQSRITQGLRDGQLVEDYRDDVRAAAQSGVPLPDGRHLTAGETSLSNPVLILDLVTLSTWDVASDSARSAAVIGSYDIVARETHRTATSVSVQYTGSNQMTLGSGVPIPSPTLKNILTEIAGESGPLSRMSQEFYWTETYDLR